MLAISVLRRMRALGARLLRERRGAMGVSVTMMTPILVLGVGMGVDYSRAEFARQRLQQAADSLVLALAQAQAQGTPMENAKARPFLDANLGEVQDLTVVDVATEQRGDGFASTTVRAKIDTYFFGLIGRTDFPIKVTSEAQYDEPPDVELNVLIDRSPSMLIGATEQAITDIGALNAEVGEPANCGFACHYTGRDSYTLAVDAGVPTRLDAAKAAVKRAFDIARDSAYAEHGDIYANVMTFTTDMEEVASGVAHTLSDDIDTIQPDASVPSDLRYTQTDFETALASTRSFIDGKITAMPDRRPFLLFITDGVADYKRGGRKIEPVDAAWCASLKNDGVKIGVIYTTYFPLYENNFYNRNVKPFEDDIKPKLEACASPGWFYEAAFAEQIDRAFEELLKLTLPKPRLTQ